MAAGNITRKLLRFVWAPHRDLTSGFLNLIKLDIRSFRTYAGSLRAERKIPAPTEAELQTYLSALKKRGINLFWGAEKFPNSDFEILFMRWSSTNTPYLSYFIRALCKAVEELNFRPDQEIELDVKKGEEFLGEKFAYLHPRHQKEIAFWLIKNREQLPAARGLVI